MISIEVFKTIVWSAYFLIFLGIILFIALFFYVEERRKNKYLIEIRGIQAYEDWKKKNMWR
jgi:hypothetical protein